MFAWQKGIKDIQGGGNNYLEGKNHIFTGNRKL